MLSKPDFVEKQIIYVFSNEGDKVSFRNDNMLILDKDGHTKLQATCHRLFAVFIVGETSITTRIIRKAKVFGFAVVLLNQNLKFYQMLGNRAEGNVFLRKRQYAYNGLDIGKHIIQNKIQNQSYIIEKTCREKTLDTRETIAKLKILKKNLSESKDLEFNQILSIEGNASRIYFKALFSNSCWIGRKPRIKPDYINAALDIGYTILFNYIDCLINLYGFDEYNGVLHKFYCMRKSLVCDLMEPMRVIIDKTTLNAINLNQFAQKDFKCNNGRYELAWDNRKKYVTVYNRALLGHKEDIFVYIRDYYRAFSSSKNIEEFPVFTI